MDQKSFKDLLKQKMTTTQINKLISSHLQEVNRNTKTRLHRIDKLLFVLNYELRLTRLSKEEKIDWVHCNEGFPLTDNQSKVLDICKTEEKRNYYIEMWARCTYLRLCAWRAYFAGESDKKPFLEQKKKQKIA